MVQMQGIDEWADENLRVGKEEKNLFALGWRSKKRSDLETQGRNREQEGSILLWTYGVDSL
jgi:hypothetical protein